MVDPTAPTDGQALVYSTAAGKAAWGTPGAGAGGVPTGTIIMWPHATPPTGYLACDAQEVSRATYAALFALIGTTFGAGDTETTFNLPDYRGRSPIGVGTGDAADATAWTLAEKGGAETHTLTSAQMPTHSHTETRRQDTGVRVTDEAPGGTTDIPVTSTQTLSTGDAGSGQAHPNMHPVLGIYFMIKT